MKLDRITDPEDLLAVAEVAGRVATIGDVLVEAGMEPQLAVRVLIAGAVQFGDERGVSRAIALATIQKLGHFKPPG